MLIRPWRSDRLLSAWSRWVEFFKSADELFEVQRGLNNVFSYDLVPNTEIIEVDGVPG